MKNPTTAIIIALGTATAAHAGPVLFEFEGTSRGKNVNIAVGDIFEGRVFAGSILHNVDTAMMGTYCIEPEQLAQDGATNFERVQLSRGMLGRDDAQARANALAELADIAGDSIWSSNYSKSHAAAFQVAAWELITDYDVSQGSASFDFEGGSFRGWGNKGVFNKASDLLSQLTFTRVDAIGYDAFTNGAHQDFMGKSVPAPAGLALVAAGIPLSLRRRRRSAEI